MKTQRRVAVGIAAAALVALGTTGCNVSFNTETQRETRTHTVKGTFPTFKVNGDGGKLEVVGTDSPDIKIVEYLRWSNSSNKPRTERIVKDGTLTLKSNCNRTVIGHNACGAGYRVEVPRATAVDLNTDSGDLRVSGLTGKSMNLNSDAGSITAEGVRTGALTATANSGSIKITGRADLARIVADAGSIDADGLHTSQITARGNSGAVKLRLTAAPDSVAVTNDSGAIKVELPDVAEGYAFDLKTDSGARDIFGLRQDSRSKHRVTISNDSGPISVTPTSGA
ncbi:hypothetical protein GCM10010191_38200 [Actinomadura vinacea]|uniref:DUF4097 domain-containing protein n=1 Tax=Actinomadura vinacea TaxID=115336 RepID=A0ABN3J5R3_9ACTN